MAKEKEWFVTRKPSGEYVMYDFARSATQAKDMLRDLAEGSPIAHRSKSEGGLYNIYVKKGSVYWRDKGGKMADGGEVIKISDLRKRFENYTDEELQMYNGDNEETLKDWNREDSIDGAVQIDINEAEGDEDIVLVDDINFYAKGGKTQGYDDRQDESLGMRTGKESSKTQSDKARREDSYGKWGKRGAEDRGTSMADGGRLNSVEVIFEDPKYNYSTSIGAKVDEEMARRYFVGMSVNVASYPKEEFKEVVDIKWSKGDGSYAKGGKIKVGQRVSVYSSPTTGMGGGQGTITNVSKEGVDILLDKDSGYGVNASFNKDFVRELGGDSDSFRILDGRTKSGKRKMADGGKIIHVKNDYNHKGKFMLTFGDEIIEDNFNSWKEAKTWAINKGYLVGKDEFKKGGKTDDWIQGVDAEMKRKGTVGAFTRQAKRAGMTVKEFTKEVLDNPEKFTKRTRERAQFARNVSKYESGGDVGGWETNPNGTHYNLAKGGSISSNWFSGDLSFLNW